MRLVHYFYSTQKTQANRRQPGLGGSGRKGLGDQAVGRRRQDKGARLGAGAVLMGGWPLHYYRGVTRPLSRWLQWPDDAAATLMRQGKERQFARRVSVRLSNSLSTGLRRTAGR
ncbi:hypothetical protein PCL1606_47660 [Pseudomonas chlororaphis]|uniref:Uncharacterized protein n=1 Tax=Pseudomonas chlororaphis TaxID=587753 RepID=A0A0D5Y4G9_9PSED|nr:hypothetical protein PCL1606_47660 [Pseudomonas chlororaphis]